MKKEKKKVFAISGSTRANSTNHSLIRAIANLMKDSFSVEVFEGIGRLPHFDPRHIDEGAPAEVVFFREKIAAADGVLICTPEYAHGVPGSLKNAIDWTVASCEFSQKPTVLITASTDGQYGHKALLETLRVIEAKAIDELQLLIRFARTKINGEGDITDAGTLGEVRQLMERFLKLL
jgi:NAD(P)H-dependent FMN reductase